MKNINHSSCPRRLTAMADSFAAVVSIGTALLLLVGIHSSQAGEIKIVSPSAYKDIEGPDGGGGGTSPFRFQQVFPAADFAALGNKPHWLVGYTFRPDQSLTSPRTVHFPDNEVRLSTTQRGPGDLSERFDENLGPDVMQFYRGLVTLAADIDGTSPVPRDFYNSEFPAGVTPYLYDPSQGNLLFDAIGWQGISRSTENDRVPGAQSTRHASSSSATTGELIPAVVFQFTFVPAAVPALDEDNDGLNDAWEIEHFGDITSQDGSGDPEGDGANNAAEQAAGTDPNEADIAGEGQFVFDPSFTIPDGTLYDVEYSTDLMEWQEIATEQTGIYTDTDATRNAAPEGYYRGVTKP